MCALESALYCSSMDHVSEIKARLPIEELVRQYCQLQPKGRNLVSLCPFHNDSHPSFLVSPDKGIAYCFACQSGGDIFSFYQKIERVDFPQALRDLAERTGVQLPAEPKHGIDKDERERARGCLEDAVAFYREQLKAAPAIRDYLQKRGVTDEEIAEFALGFAPDSFEVTYAHLLKRGHSKSDIVHSGMAVEKSLAEDRRYDRFRNRLMFPVHDAQGRLAGFGGRTMGGDDAKYINSSDGVLFHKSQILFNIHRAKEAMRKTDTAIVVEGYFDVLAVRRVGCDNVVATCGTALTPEHGRLLKRAVSTVVLCLDSDRAGLDAAERAFLVLAPEGIDVRAVALPQKDPADLAQSDPSTLKELLTSEAPSYIDIVLRQLAQSDVRSAAGKRAALERVKPLLAALPSSVERSHYKAPLAALLGVTESEIERDLQRSAEHRAAAPSGTTPSSLFSSAEISLGLLLLYPRTHVLISEMIEPDADFPAALYKAIKKVDADTEISVDMLDLPQELKEKAKILYLYCEQSGFGIWSELSAPREIRRNIAVANREFLRRKQREISEKLFVAQKAGKVAEEELLRTQYHQLLKLAKLSA